MHLTASDQIVTVYFYLPHFYWQEQESLSTDLNSYLNGSMSLSDLWVKHVRSHSSLKSDGLFAWIILPFLHLKSRGLDCQLVAEIPSQGIVFLPRKFVQDDLKPSSSCLFVMNKLDCKVHPYSQIHVVENPNEELIQKPSSLWKSTFIPHFPHPGLCPRDEKHGDRFENLAYFGLERNLAPELQAAEWETQLKALGFKWFVVDREYWHDYTNIDAIIAVRSFDSCSYNWKPASKLYNAWHAGVPTILGAESGFQSERKSLLDYIEANSVEQIINAIKMLRDNKDLRAAMMKNAKLRAQDTLPQIITNHWISFLYKEAFPYYHRWINCSNRQKKIFILSRTIDVKSRKLKSQQNRVKHQARSWIKQLLSKV